MLENTSARDVVLSGDDCSFQQTISRALDLNSFNSIKSSIDSNTPSSACLPQVDLFDSRTGQSGVNTVNSIHVDRLIGYFRDPSSATGESGALLSPVKSPHTDRLIGYFRDPGNATAGSGTPLPVLDGLNGSIRPRGDHDRYLPDTTIGFFIDPESPASGVLDFSDRQISVKATDAAYRLAKDVPEVNESQFSTTAKRVLAKLDPEGRGVTREELARAMQDPTFTGQEAQVLAAMYANFDGLHNLSKHEGWFGKECLTASDLDKYDQLQKGQAQTSKDAVDMRNAAGGIVRDYAHDGQTLNKADVQKALNDPNTPEWDRKMLSLIDKHWSELGDWYRRGVNESDFDTFEKSVANSDEARLILSVQSTCERVALAAQKKGESYDLYATKDPLRSIKPEDVKQGTISDCYFEAVLAAVAKSNPAIIRDAIKDNHDGTYTVTFPGAPNEPITVKAPTQAELGLYNQGSKDGVWAAVMEKAFAQYHEHHAGFSRGDTPQIGIGRPDYAGPVVELLTGHKPAEFEIRKSTQATMADILQTAFSAHPPKAVVAAIAADDDYFKHGETRTPDDFLKMHEYTVVGFVPDGHGGGTVIVRNPYGGKDGTTDGTMKIPLATFMNNFSNVTVQQ